MPVGSDALLVVNAGSSSIKVAVFDAGLALQLTGAVDGIGTRGGALRLGDEGRDVRFADHAEALEALIDALAGAGVPLDSLRATAHRVVHGGTQLVAPVRVDDAVVAEIGRCADLAPLHNPHNLAAIEAVRALAPAMPHFASFDTAFHATNPEVATTYAVPPAITARGIRRYGFHGISYAALTRALPRISGAPLPPRLLAFHLGNGASICAIRDGRSVATTMGYSPLEGLTMGTRCGGIDGNAVLRLVEEDGIAATHRLLNFESGLKGLSGYSPDMRRLLGCDTTACDFAVEHFCYWALRHAGSLIAALGGLDAVAFTGGIGEHAAPIRALLMEGLGWIGLRWDSGANDGDAPRLHRDDAAVGAWIVPAEEERMIAEDAASLMERV